MAVNTDTIAQNDELYGDATDDSSNPPASTGSSGTTGTLAPSSFPTAQQIQSTAPAPIQDFGSLPTVAPTYATAATVDPNAQYGYLQQEEAANAASLAPGNAVQDSNLQDSLAARGISSSGAGQQLYSQLQGQQQATLAGMNAPAIAQQSGYTQADIAANQTNEQGTNIFNAGEGTAATGANANFYATALGSNEANYNNYQNELYSTGATEGNELLTAYLNSYGPNTGVQTSINNEGTAANNIYGSVYGNATSTENAALGDAATYASSGYA